MAGNENDFLSAMVAKAPVETAPAATDTEQEQPQVETAAVVSTETAAAKVETTATESDADKHVPLAALMAERDKRKEAAKRAEELENRIKELEGQHTPAALPDFYQNPEVHVQQAVSQAVGQVQDRLYAALEEAERERHADFDEVMKEVMERAQENPAIAAEILKGKNPAAEAYKVGKRLRDFEKSQQDPDAFRAQLKAELLAELKREQELEALKAEKSAAVEASIPPDLSAARSATSTVRPRPKSTVVDALFPKT